MSGPNHHRFAGLRLGELAGNRLREVCTVRKMIAAGILTLIVTAPVAAEAPTYLGYPVVNVMVNGSLLVPSVPAIIMDGRTLLPVRDVARIVGAMVAWDAERQTVILTAPDVAVLQRDLATTKARAEVAEQTQASLRTAVKDLRDQVAVLKVPSADVSALQGAVSNLSADKKRLTDELAAAKKAVETAQLKLASAKRDLDAAKTEIASLLPRDASLSPDGLVRFGNLKARLESGWTRVLGELTNLSQSPHSYSISIVFYDSNGGLLGIADDYVSSVRPGEKRVFDALGRGDFVRGRMAPQVNNAY